MSHLTIKPIKVNYNTKNLTEEQIAKYKRYEKNILTT